jgi:hypothetical protein
MRCVTATLSLAAVVLMAVDPAGQTRPSFAGEWKVKGQLVGPEGDMTITQDASTITLQGGEQTVAPVKVTYKLDGSVSRNTPAGTGGKPAAEQTSKAVWAGNAIVVTTTTSQGEQTRRFSIEGGELVVKTATRGGAAPPATTVTYIRRVPGHGG